MSVSPRQTEWVSFVQEGLEMDDSNGTALMRPRVHLRVQFDVALSFQIINLPGVKTTAVLGFGHLRLCCVLSACMLFRPVT